MIYQIEEYLTILMLVALVFGGLTVMAAPAVLLSEAVRSLRHRFRFVPVAAARRRRRKRALVAPLTGRPVAAEASESAQ
ncbi:MAG TPA: hypothetical protein VIH17_02580 [Candidatus Acidoferrales bacterium]